MNERNLTEVVMTVKLGRPRAARGWLSPEARNRSEKTAERGGESVERWWTRWWAERETASYWRRKGSMGVVVVGMTSSEGRWKSKEVMWGWVDRKVVIWSASAEERQGRIMTRVTL